MRSSRSNRQLVIAVCVSMIFSFLYGVITVQYKIFPFDQLRTIKQLVSPSPNPSYSDHFYHKKSFFELHGGHQYDVVFIGDSITEGAEWEDLFPSLKIANRGISGDRTDGVLKRMDSIYSTNARKAFIMIGGNDFVRGAEVNDVVQNYKSIISNLVAHGMQTYVQSTILVGNRIAKLNKKIMALNAQLKKMADENKTFTYIDLNAGLARGSVLDSKYSRDDMHLNGSGYAVWKDIVKSYIQ
jgi:lysophospholipase L1-like esterase